MEGDESNPNYYLDDMSDSFELNRMTKDKKRDIINKKQKEIDDIAIGIILRALENGIPLNGDRVYEEMLEQYPHY